MANFEAKVKAVLDNTSISDIETKINNANIKLTKFDVSSSNIRSEIEKQLQKPFNIKINPVIAGNGSGSGGKQSISKKLEDSVKFKIDSGAIEAQYGRITASFNKLSGANDKLQKNMTTLSTSYNTMMHSGDIQEQVKAYQEFSRVSAVVNSQIKNTAKFESDAAKAADQFAKAAKEQLKADTRQNRAQSTISNIQNWMNKNPKAAVAYGSEIDTIIEKLKDPALSGDEFANLTSRLNAYKAAAKEAGLTTSPLVQNLKQLFGIGSTLAIMQKGIQTVKQMAQETIKVDTAMTELRRVTNLSAGEEARLYDSMTQSAKNYGAELDTMINSTASWVRLGFDANTANKLAEISTMYQHVTDLDEATAVNNLVTAYMGYKESLLQATGGGQVAAMTRISDVYDLLGNSFPVTAANVAEGMDRSAAVLQDAGASFEQASAMVTGGGSVTQDFASTGSALKIATLRVRSMKGALEELGEEIDENVISSSKMQTQILNLTKGEVNIFEEDGKTFRNIYEIFDDIAGILPKLSEADSSALLETIAGRRSYQYVQKCA